MILDSSVAKAADAEALADPRLARAGDSLWIDAWKRLRKNRMAMIGLVITVVMSFVSILADFVSPFDPEDQQRWTGALPPGAEVLSLRNEMRFQVGAYPEELDVPAPAYAVLGDGEPHALVLTVQQERVAPLRLIVENGLLKLLELRPPGEGIVREQELVLGDREYLRWKPSQDVAGDVRIETQRLAVGEPPPPELAQADSSRYVVQLEMVRRRADDRFDVDVAFAGSGQVETVVRAGAPVESGILSISAGEVANLTLDGRRLAHTHLLGTDQEGRDTLSRLIHGGKISLLVGITATLVSLLVGVLYGAVSGYLGGATDAVMMRIVDILYGLPYLFLVILMLVTFGRSIINLFIALGLVQWLTMARIVRGQVLSLREKEFVDAAVTVGTGTFGILLRHLIPNTIGVVVVYTTLTVPAVILQESFLSFLGLTVEMDGRPLESWGALVNYGREALGANGEFWWLLVWPSIAMSVTLFSLNFLGDGLRDALDPQQRGRG